MATATRRTRATTSTKTPAARGRRGRGAAGPRGGTGRRVPIVDYLRLGERPYLRARRCTRCGARYFDRRNACASCGGREFRNARVRNRGRVRAFTIVHRAAPGIPVPYVSAIVETDDGMSVRSNIVNCEPDPDHVRLGMKVKLTTYSIGTDDEGTEAVAFGYEPV